MENLGNLELQNLANEISQGKELVQQLQDSLERMISSDETCKFLIQSIQNSYEKALSLLNSCKDLDGKEYRSQSASTKRNAIPTLKKKVQLSPGTNLEVKLDDGFSWKKYGQKDILGAKYPRGYYSCAHKFDRGCQATKKVQRSNSDPSIVEITYVGGHRCNLSCPNPSLTLPKLEEPNPIHNYQQSISQSQLNQQELLPSSSRMKPEKYIFLDPMIVDDFLGSFVSESDFFAVSPTLLSNFGGNHDGQASEPEMLTPFASSSTSGTSTPTVDSLALPFGSTDFDSNFPFDFFP